MGLFKAESKYIKDNPTLTEFLATADVDLFNTSKIPFFKTILFTLQQELATKLHGYDHCRTRSLIMHGQINAMEQNISVPTHYGTLITQCMPKHNNDKLIVDRCPY